MEGIWYAIWPRTGGRSPDELRDDQVEVLGRLMARTDTWTLVGGAAVSSRASQAAVPSAARAHS